MGYPTEILVGTLAVKGAADCCQRMINEIGISATFVSPFPSEKNKTPQHRATEDGHIFQIQSGRLDARWLLEAILLSWMDWVFATCLRGDRSTWSP